MKNKLIYIFIYIFINLFFTSNLNSKDVFSFNVTEIQITQDGNLFKGYNGGEAFTNDGVSITAKNFEYNKITNILITKKNVKLIDKKKNIIINADQISYLKNEEKVIANGNVHLEDKSKNITINTIKITYLKNISKIYSEGKTEAYIGSKYKFYSKDVTFLKDEMKLYSSNKTIINDDNLSTYELGSFDYEIKKEFLKGTDISIIENSSLPPGKSDKLYFSNGFFNLKNENFKAGNTKIKLKKNLFDRPENDPRLYGVSSTKKGKITTVKKAVFTSCKKTDSCPPWRLEASQINHDKNKKQLIYDDAILKVYDIPVFYFPKFFHPDPTVKRQSGFLVPSVATSATSGNNLILANQVGDLIDKQKDIISLEDLSLPLYTSAIEKVEDRSIIDLCNKFINSVKSK